ncbi:MAG: type II toxin-antitoxin system HicA family toxin [Chloroflexi bacterium]|nr:type II toxin-antitoxin system HicA family toxin [Chloroflexota bacterium]
MRYREAERKLRRLGCEELPRRSGGSHRKWHNPATGQGTVLPDWGGKDLNPQTLRDAVHQLGIAWEDFERA